MNDAANPHTDHLAVPDTVVQSIARTLKDLAPYPELRDDLLYAGAAHTEYVPSSLIPLPALVYFVLARVLQFPYMGPVEKTAWTIPLLYRQHLPCTLSLGKFGLRFHVAASTTTPEAAAEVRSHVVRQLSHAIRAVEMRVLQPFALTQLGAGLVTVKNQFVDFDNMYYFFRTEAKRHFAPADTPDSGAAIRPPFRLQLPGHREGYYCTVAMLDAYYSRLEHFLILSLAFGDFDPARDDLRKLIGASWRDKFRRAFPLSSGEANTFFSRLCDAKERYRNTFSHGGFDKEGATLGFHLPGVGAIPAQLSAIRGSPHFHFIPLSQPEFEIATTLFDEFDAWIETTDRRFALRYASSGLDVPFDPAAIETHRRAMSSDDAFETLLARRSYLWERAVNMDF